MHTIGLTGGIGTGKTTIAKIFEELHYPVYYSDTEASRLINSLSVIQKSLCEAFGEDIYTADGILNKRKMADIIFNDKEALLLVNNIVHPEVLKDFINWKNKQKGKIVIFESAILYEASLHTHFDYIICVHADIDTRIKRVCKRDHTTEEKVIERIVNQMDNLEKCKKADFIINTNDGEDIYRQIQEISDRF